MDKKRLLAKRIKEDKSHTRGEEDLKHKVSHNLK